jgi:hypothetical protein
MQSCFPACFAVSREQRKGNHETLPSLWTGEAQATSNPFMARRITTMNLHSLQDVQPDEFGSALTKQVITVLQIIHAAMGISVLIFLMVVVLLAIANTARVPVQSEVNLIRTLTFADGIVAIVCYLLGGYLFMTRFKVDRLRAEAAHSQTPAGSAVALIRRALILRLVLFEAAALVGLAMLLLAAMSGVLGSDTLALLNGLPTLLFFLFLALNFPTRARITSIFNLKVRCV